MENYLEKIAIKELIKKFELKNIAEIKGKRMWDSDLRWEKKDDGWYIQVKPAHGFPPHVDIQWVFIALTRIYFIENNKFIYVAKELSSLYKPLVSNEDYTVIEEAIYQTEASLQFLECLKYLNEEGLLHKPNLDEILNYMLPLPFREYLEYTFLFAMKRHLGDNISTFTDNFETKLDDSKKPREFLNHIGSLIYRNGYNYTDIVITLNHFFPELASLELTDILLPSSPPLKEVIKASKEEKVNLKLLNKLSALESTLNSVKQDTTQISEINEIISSLNLEYGELSFLIKDLSNRENEKLSAILEGIDDLHDTVYETNWNTELISKEIKEILNSAAYSNLSKQEKESIEYKINDSEIAIKHKLKLTIPIIGKYLAYQGELELSNKQKLPKNLEELRKLFFKDE